MESQEGMGWEMISKNRETIMGDLSGGEQLGSRDSIRSFGEELAAFAVS
jgi:hypothetical protein